MEDRLEKILKKVDNDLKEFDTIISIIKILGIQWE
jgi:hypothetical protein